MIARMQPERLKSLQVGGSRAVRTQQPRERSLKLNLTNARRRFRDSNAVAAYLFNQLCLLLVFSQPARLEKLFFQKGKLRGVRCNDERLGKLCLPQWGGGEWGQDARRSWKKFPRTQLPKSKLFQILSKHGTAASKRMRSNESTTRGRGKFHGLARTILEREEDSGCTDPKTPLKGKGFASCSLK